MSVKVKVCGITRADDALLASDLGASAVGFVFWEPSPRYVTPERAAQIVKVLPPDVAAVGVFVDPTRSYVESVTEGVGLTAVQLHGDEPPEFGLTLPYRVMMAAPLQTADDVQRARDLPTTLMVLLDVADPVKKGGTGRRVDWSLASRVARYRRVFLAGGLHPANVTDAIRAVSPYGVDVSSGLESAPGIKDSGRLRAFFAAVAAIGPISQASEPWGTETQG